MEVDEKEDSNDVENNEGMSAEEQAEVEAGVEALLVNLGPETTGDG